MTDVERLTARIVGSVQGVGYRWWAGDTATRLGLVGWVRNDDDERAVELVAEGRRSAIEAFESQLSVGPGSARVERVETSRGPASGGMTRFEVRR